MAAKNCPLNVVFVVDGHGSRNLYYAMAVLDHGSTFEIENRIWNGQDFVWQNYARTNGLSIDTVETKKKLEHRGFLKRLSMIPARHKVLGIIDITYEKLGLVFFKEIDGGEGTRISKSLIEPV